MTLQFIVVDIEATCWPPGDERRGRQSDISEIIEIYAYVLSDVEVKPPFHMIVRPNQNPQLSSFCKELTGISQLDIDRAQSSEGFIVRWEEWLQSVRAASPKTELEIASWGTFDQVLLKRAWGQYRPTSPPWAHLDIKFLFESFCRAHRGEDTDWFQGCSLERISGLSLREAMKAIQSEFTGRVHSARSDTIAAGECLRFIMEESQVTPREGSLLSLIDRERRRGESLGIDRPAYWGESARVFAPNKQEFQRIAAQLIKRRFIQQESETGALRRRRAHSE